MGDSHGNHELHLIDFRRNSGSIMPLFTFFFKFIFSWEKGRGRGKGEGVFIAERRASNYICSFCLKSEYFSLTIYRLLRL